MRRKKGFTFIELLIVVVLMALVIGVTFRVVGVTFGGLKDSSKNYDIQNNVRNSLRNVENILKPARQIFFVDKNIYDPSVDYTSFGNSGKDHLDTKFNYLAIKNTPEGGNTLINLVWTKDGWLELPLTSDTKIMEGKKNDLYDGKARYKIELYKGQNSTEKINKKVINVTVTGFLKSPDGDKSYSLSEDIKVQNANQILFSKYMQGGLGTVTAIAYSPEELIATKTQGEVTETFAIAFVLDVSESMYHDLNYITRPLDNSSKDGLPFAGSRMEYAVKAIISSPDSFLNGIKNIKVDQSERDKSCYPKGYEQRIDSAYSDIDSKIKPQIKTYFVPYIEEPLFIKRDRRERNTDPYNLKFLYESGVGPYNLSNDKDFLKASEFLQSKDGAKMCQNGHLSYPNGLRGGTNTGEALMQAMYLLKNSGQKNKYLVLLSDGVPANITIDKNIILGESSLKAYSFNDVTNALYTNPENSSFPVWRRGILSSDQYRCGIFTGRPNGRNCVGLYIGEGTARDLMGELPYYNDMSKLTPVDDLTFSKIPLDKREGILRDLRGSYVPINTQIGELDSFCKINNTGMDYCKKVTDPSEGFNQELTKVFLIGYSGLDIDKLRIGFPGPNGKPQRETLYSYFKRSSSLQTQLTGNQSNNSLNAADDPVKTYDTSGELDLIKAMKDITDIISYDVDNFTGPEKKN